MGVFDGKSYIEEGFESFRGGLRDPGALRPCQKWCLCGHTRKREEGQTRCLALHSGAICLLILRGCVKVCLLFLLRFLDANLLCVCSFLHIHLPAETMRFLS